MKNLFSVILAFTFTSWMLASAEKADVSDFARSMTNRIGTAMRERIPNLIVKNLDLQRLNLELRPGDDAKNTPTLKTNFDALNYEILVAEDRAQVSVSVFDSEDEASIQYEKLVNLIPVGPIIDIPHVGDAAIRIAGTNEILTGTLFFRRGRLVVQVNSPKADLSVQIAPRIHFLFQQALREQQTSSPPTQ